MKEMLEFFEYVVMLVSWDVLDVLLFSRFIIFGFCKILVYLKYMYICREFYYMRRNINSNEYFIYSFF